MSISGSKHDSVVNDESVHIPAGISYVQTGDLRINNEHPVLIKYLSGLSVTIFTDANIDTKSPSWKATKDWELGKETLYKSKTNNADDIAFWARVPILLTSVALALIIYSWSRMMFGKLVGLGSLTLFALDPTMIAYSHLVTFDLPAATFITGSALFLWLGIRKQSYKHFTLSGLMLGLALASKASAIAFLPILLITLFISIFLINRTDGLTLNKKLFHFTKALGTISLVTTATIWVTYLIAEKTATFRLSSILPASFVESMRLGLDRFGADKPTYINGTIYDSGQHWFLGFSFLLKSPIPLLALLASCLFGLIYKKNRNKNIMLFVLFPALALFIIASISTLNWGIRYLFFVYPFIFILAGYGLSLFTKKYFVRDIAIVTGLSYYLFSLSAIHPNYISYVNELRGSKHRYEIFSGSNVEWGQGHKELNKFATKNKLNNMTIAYWNEPGTEYYSLVNDFSAIAVYDFEDKKIAIRRLEKANGTLAVSTYLANNLGMNKTGYRLNGHKPSSAISESWLIYNMEK